MSRRILGVFQLAALALSTLPTTSGCSTADTTTAEAPPVASGARDGNNEAIGNTAVARDGDATSPLPEPLMQEQGRMESKAEERKSDAPMSSAATPGTMPVSPAPMAARRAKGSGGAMAGGWDKAKDVAAPTDDTSGEDYAAITENAFMAVADDPRSTFSIDVDTASYSNVRRFLEDGQKPPTDAVRIEELVNYFDYDYDAPTGSTPFSVDSEVSSCPWNSDHLLVHVGLQGKKIDRSEVPARNLVFLFDVSGSMNSPDKLPLLQRAMALLVEDLRKEDRVSIVVYAGASGLVLEPTNDKAEILAALERLQSGGSTNGGAGIELAYRTAETTFVKGGINRVILATDGDFNVGTTSQSDLVKMIEDKRKSGVFLSVLGFGTGNVKDSTMEMLADKGNGNYAYIDSLSEARKVLVEEGGSTLVTIAKDVKIQVEFNPKEVADYRLIGYENRKLAHTDFNDDTKDAGEIGAGHSVTALYEVVPVGSKDAGKPAVDGLKYQDEAAKPSKAADSGELMTVKIRYKQPDGDKSDLLSFAITGDDRTLDKTSDDFRFAAAVAEFGMLLRDSKFKGTADWKQVERLAEGALGSDPNGRRKEFLRLVAKAKG